MWALERARGWLILIGTVVGFVSGQQLICENRKPEGHTLKETEGDGGFRIVVVGNYTTRGHYSPNDVYTVTIQGLKTRYSTQKFTEFLLVAESEKQLTMGQTGLMTTGVFHIIDDFHSRYSDTCPDGVTNTNMQPKTEISVLWTAPSTLVASCITFKATVVERPHVWYKDDGQLTKVLCPELPRRMRQQRPHRVAHHHQPSPDQGQNRTEPGERKVRRNHGMIKPSEAPQVVPATELSQRYPQPLASDFPTTTTLHPPTTTTGAPSTTSTCCACDEAKYEVRFEGIWSKETHPKDFPENEWLLHFSDIIGASHSPEYSVWQAGKVASEGIRQVAEWGATRHLETEMKSKSRHINTIIKAKGLWHPEERGTTSAAFRVDRNHHLMSLVSMIGPSPDWIVGITSFNLCLSNCTWLEEADFDLYPYDAGTDSGITYMSPNAPTEPRQSIRALTSQDPDDPRSPFYGVEPMQPFAKATLRRQRIYPKHCNDTTVTKEDNREIFLTENSEDSTRPECAVSEWTSWSDCSVTCGKGLRMRKRSYLLPMKADMFRCDRQLVEKEMCLGSEPSCAPDNTSAFEEFDSICAVSAWTEWTPCSVTCGKGTRTRSRRYKNHMGRKKCLLEMTQTEMCVVSLECPKAYNETEINEKCPLTPWSQWTPCSVTCGIGIRERTRFPLLTEESDILEYCGGLLLSQRATCTGEFGITCQLSRSEAEEICSLPPDVGSCRSNHTKYYYSSQKSMCVPFDWSGCKGNRNRFDTLQECIDVCGFLQSVWNHHLPSSTELSTSLPEIPSSQLKSLDTYPDPPFLPSVSTPPVTPSPLAWPTYPPPPTSSPHTPDSEPETDDDEDKLPITPRQATVLSVASKDFRPPTDCVVSRWSTWSECSVTCGIGLRTRTRSVLIHPHNGGKLCPRLEKKKSCRLDPCSFTYSS